MASSNTILINRDFRVFNDMVETWTRQYANDPNARAAVEAAVREWFQQHLVEAVIGALALKATGRWSEQEIEKLWSQDALTAVVLPRYHVHLAIRKSLRQKIGSLVPTS